MKNLTYNDMEFSATRNASGWNISRKLLNGDYTLVGAGLFAKLPDDAAEASVIELIKKIFPVGIKLVGPDVAHPNMVGDLKIVGPDVNHPNFIYWNQDSTSFDHIKGMHHGNQG